MCIGMRLRRHSGGVTSERSALAGGCVCDRQHACTQKKRTRAAGFHSNPGLTYTWKRRLCEIIGHTTSALKNRTFVLPSQCVKIRPGEPSLKQSRDFFFWKCSINISDFASLLSARCASFKQANRVD